MLYRTLKAAKPAFDYTAVHSYPFSDYDTISSWAREAVGYLYSIEVINGVGDNQFSPKENTSREEAIVLGPVCRRDSLQGGGYLVGVVPCCLEGVDGRCVLAAWGGGFHLDPLGIVGFSIVGSPEFELIEALLGNIGDEHPKMMKVREIVEQQISTKANSKVMVFTNYRDSCEAVAKCLSQIDGVRVSRLVGQQDRFEDKGLNQKEQVEVLSKFRKGELNTVVATCVGEEGLDIANTDLVVFYEPVASEIRSIQRRGRTGRSRPGKVVILVTKETKDERSNLSSNRKEEAMKRQILRLKKQLESERSEQLSSQTV
jgi:hypothetical protein